MTTKWPKQKPIRNVPSADTYHGDRLHPETLKNLRELVRLHGVRRLIAALNEMEK